MRVARAQEFVARGRAVAANHIDFTTGIVERRGQVVEKIEKPRIEMAHISGTVVAQIMVKLVQRRECIDRRDGRRYPAARPCECDRSEDDTRVRSGKQILCRRARAAAPAETRESATNNGGWICSLFSAMTPMLVHSHSKSIAALGPFYVRSGFLGALFNRDNRRPTLSQVLRHSHRYRRKTESDFPRSLSPYRIE